LIYRHLIETFDLETAQSYAEANRIGMEKIRDWIERLEIKCDYEKKDAYAYINSRSGISDLEAEAAAAAKVGFEADLLERAPLPFKTAGALRFRAQAQFNPAQYLIGLAKATAAEGAQVFEESRVISVDDRDGWHLKISQRDLRAKSVVLATNLPIAGPIPYDERTRPRSHPALAFRVDSRAAIEGMFISVDEPKRSLRMGRDKNGLLLVVLGSKFETGHEGDVAKRLRDLEIWTRQNLQVGDLVWRWVNEDYDTADRMPFAGRVTQEADLYVATGFNAWGISNGTAAGMLIAEQILGRTPHWASIYDPARKASDEFNEGGDSRSLIRRLDDIKAGEGGILTLGKGKIAVWKDANGNPQAFSASCTHKGCVVTWNNADQTWDCPCHGSIFAKNGSVIHGPAVEPLAPKKLPPNWHRYAQHS
jgi:glycine/D-amino acid oxidase-like deaminating enzyme/nitrite reductase/ring-hydroxylating ferredoxin subunit